MRPPCEDPSNTHVVVVARRQWENCIGPYTSNMCAHRPLPARAPTLMSATGLYRRLSTARQHYRRKDRVPLVRLYLWPHRPSHCKRRSSIEVEVFRILRMSRVGIRLVAARYFPVHPHYWRKMRAVRKARFSFTLWEMGTKCSPPMTF